jgi:thiol:disulfide interchange protein/DsbC/DsbD-like thiol-disulfide interchange protein
MSLSNAVRRRASGALAFLFSACAAALAVPAGAQSPAQPPDHAATPQVRVRLLAPVDAVHPGEQLLLGLEQQLEPGWHTYWTNPGDTGVPTRIDWTLPAGAHAGPIEWPVPTRFRTGPVTSYGYEHRVTLLSAVTVPADAKAGSTLPVRAKVSWLVCKDVCIPQQAELGLVLPVLAVGMPAGQGRLATGPARAALPDPLPASAGVQASTDGKAVALTLEGGPFTGEGLEDLWFYAEQRGRIAPGAAQVPHVEDSDRDKSGRIVLHLRAGEQPLLAGQRLGGILVLRKRTPAGSVAHGYRIEVALTPSSAPIALPPLQAEEAEAPVSTATPALPLGLPLAMLLALLGGAILNLMPCVFPVLSIKALSLLNHAQDGGGGTVGGTPRRHGIAYTLGVLASFALLGGVLILLKAGGAQVGWGFQFQSTPFVLGTAFLMFAVGLNLSGVFEVGASLAGIGSSLAARGGTTGSFFAGVLATVVATPCTAPFMGGAVAFALAQPPGVLLAVFLSMGAGLALPYLLLSSWPVLQRRLPRPGAWMERMRQALAFPMYATAVWLVWVLAQQGGVNAVPVALGGMVAIAFAAWLYGSTRLASPRPRRIGGAAAVVVAAAALGAGFTAIGAARPESVGSASLNADPNGWTPYSAERLAQLRAQGRPVFVNLTASWCITCLVNEKVALRERSVTDAFRRAGIAALEGDWTNQDDRITALLSRFGRSGVPLYVYYPPGTASEPVVLPQLLTPDVVLAAIKVPAASTAALQNGE